ncbi:carbohydrate ABC transporter permease [Lentzea aerocolonigenes]|uniref:carbohydrate ABC transporter permease n=1 Tax=Lentzea aerocolonigenes TaxID=68170 RepID=UPI0005ED3EFE|nr:sugar ABC transporter permease [Lentzea aerocolonigenes]
MRRLRELLTVLAFLLPVLVLFGAFRFLPMLGAAGLSVTDYRPGGDFEFVGAENYAGLFEDQYFLASLRTTLTYVAIYVPLILVVALGTALLLHSVPWGRGFFRAALFAPYVTSLVLSGVIWKWLFEPAGLLQDPSTVLPALAIVGVWKGFGYAMLILLAGIRNVPADCLEAATVDGANVWQRFRHMLLPSLRPAMFFVVVVETIGAFQVFDLIYVMTTGGPVRASYTLAYAVYQYGFTYFEVGKAAAAGLALWAIVLLVSLTQRRAFERNP